MTFWGVRGSSVTPGPTTLKYGGHTTCVEVVAGPRRVIVDAGSGIIELGAALREKPPRTIDIVFSHLHHDHTEGLFFFAPMFIPDTEITLHCGHLDGRSPEEALRQCFSPPLFPLGFDDVPARVRFRGFRAGETLDLDGLAVRTHPLNHPGGATGYRIDHDGAAVAVLTDNEHTEPWPDPALTSFVAGCDLVAYDAMWEQDEYDKYRGWGHSTPQMGAALVRAAGAGRLACIHHAPNYDDERLSRIEAEIAASSPGAFLAREGMSLTLPAVRR